MSRKLSLKTNLTKSLLALIIAFSLFWPIKFIQAIPLAPVLSGAEGAIGAAAGFPVITTKSPIQKIFDFLQEQFKEVAALAWKSTQVYFGTRLAHDAAVYLASGGRGQSSFIWNWDEVKELADGAAGEFLDNLSQDYFGKSACVPGDLNAQVQIDLNARALIGEAMDYATASIPNVCEAICSRTALGAETTTRTVTGVGGDAAALFGQGMDASKVNKDLAEYDKAVDDLINSILDSEEEMSRAIGKYIFEQVNYTLHGGPTTKEFPQPPGCENVGFINSDFITPEGKVVPWENININDFYSCLTGESSGVCAIYRSVEDEYCGIAGHGPRFADLVKKILDMSGVDTLEEVAAVFEKQDMATFNQLSGANPPWAWDKNNVIDALGARYLVYGMEYESADPGADQIPPKDNSVEIVRNFFTEAYFLFDEMKSAPAAAVDLEPLLEMIGNDDAVIPKIRERLGEAMKQCIATSGQPTILENSQRGEATCGIEMRIIVIPDEIFNLADEVIALKTEIMTTHGADLDELVKSYQNFSQCVEACERGQIAEPHGACTLSEITKQEGFMGVTGIEGGVTGTMDLGPFGSVTDSWQEGTAIGKGRDEHAQEMKEGARLTVADLQDLSTIGDPANNPLGQMLQIAEKSQRQSEEAKERELTESQRAFASDKDLVSGTIKMPGSQVEGRLTGALADIRAANNEYTGSILAQMWGVFFNTLIKEFQEKLFGQGLQPKVYSGPFDPTTRRAYGEGIEAAKEQFSKFANPNITAGGEMNSQILTRLTSGCKEQPDNQQKFDECIIDNHFKDAIEQQMTLDEAVKKNLVRGVFGFHKNGNQPIVGQGIPYNSMIVLRKYRIIPASWEAAAIWVRDVVSKEQNSKDVTIDIVMAGYKDKTLPYYGLVNPGWLLKLPLFQCARQGAGEQIVSQSPMPYDSYFSEEGDFTVNISRMNDYCGDAKSCIREKNDGSGCEALGYGYCTQERDFWRFPSESCKDEALYKTCQAYIDPNNQSVAYLDQTLNLDECDPQSDGCQGYLRDYNWSRLTGGVSPRIDGLSDNAFTYAPDRFVEGFEEGEDYPLAGAGTVAEGLAESLKTNALDQGIVTSVDATTIITVETLTEESPKWIPMQWVGYTVNSVSTKGEIISNTENTLTVKSWSNDPINSGDNCFIYWTPNQWLNATVYINTGQLKGAYSLIKGNRSDTLTGLKWLNVPDLPRIGDSYKVVSTDLADEFTGNIEEVGQDFLTDTLSNPNWLENQWVDGLVQAQGFSAKVVSNDSDTLFIDIWNKPSMPNIGAGYQIYFTQPPTLNPENIVLNPLGAIDPMPSLWQCFNYDPEVPEQYGESCIYERIAGRKEGCKLLPSGVDCYPWKEVSLTKCEMKQIGAFIGECYFAPPDEVSCLINGEICDGSPELTDTNPDTGEKLTLNAKIVLGAVSVNPIKLVEPDSAQIYWCGLPGGAGCFVGQESVTDLITLTTDLQSTPPRTDDPPRHTTQIAGIRCVVGAWTYNNDTDKYIFQAVPDVSGSAPLTCSLYRQSQDETAIGGKRVYLTGNAQQCSLDQAGCQEYFGVDFPSNEYTIDDENELTIDDHFLTAKYKKAFITNLLAKAQGYYDDLKEEFTYDDISLSEIMPDDLAGAVFESEPKIVRKPLNFERRYCTEKDIDCRKYYPESGAEPLAGVLDPRKDLCPDQCAGYARYQEPITQIENRLGTSIVIDADGNITTPERKNTLDRYFIADREEQCPAQSAGCEYFMYKPNDAPSAKDLYLTDLRLCVNTQYYLDEPDYRAVYTIIESAAKGATNPVNIELVKSNYIGPVFYQIDGEQVQVSKIDFACGNDSCGQLYLDGYHAPCITIDPTKQGGKTNPDTWECTDDEHFDDEIKPALERCLTVKTLADETKQVVSNLAKAECREYIYFPEALGAERYALPYDLPIRVSSSCTAFKRGGAKSAFIYNIDSDSEVLKNMRCEESYVSCREYLGQGGVLSGPLSWVDFEDVAKWGKWTDGIIDNSNPPALGPNVNNDVDEALKFTGSTDYVYNILEQPLDPVNSEKLFRDNDTGKVKSFKLSLWAQADKDTVINIELKDKDGNTTVAKFQVDDVNHRLVFYKTSDSKWHYIVFNQVFLDAENVVPHYLYVNSTVDISLDSIVLEDSSSIFRKQRDLAFVGAEGYSSIASHVDKDCNTDFNLEEPAYDPDHPFPYQLSCQAYTTDNVQPIFFKANTISLCKDEVVGCEALINTFNTQNPASETFWPREKDTAGLNPSYDDYFVPKDSIEYVVASSQVQCEENKIGCAMLGREIKDQAGKVTGFEEKYLIDLPIQYQDPNQPTACLIKEQSCQLYKTKETGIAKRFKSPNPFSCEWTSPDSEHPTDWYKSVDEGGKIEYCDSWYEQLDPAIDLEIKRPRGFCIEQYTDRPVLDPEDELTAWCDPDDERSLAQIETGGGEWQHINSANTCLDFIDVDFIDGSGNNEDPNISINGDVHNDLPENLNDGIDELNVKCAQAVAQCPVDQSECTWFKDPLKSGLDKNYFQIHPASEDIKGCGNTVNDDLGCVLFDDTEEGGPLKYDAEKSWNTGFLDTDCNPEDCYGEDGKLLPVDQWPNSNYCRTDYEKCDANVLLRVKRDRACGEWLACKSAMTTDDKKDTVCLDVKPCNVRSADGECVNFVGDAKQSFTNKEIAESKELFSRAGRLSGYSNMGYEWYQCPNPADDIVIIPDKKGDLCTTGKECIKEDRLYKKGGDCLTLILDTCSDSSHICQEGKFKGQSCQLDKDCYSDDELEHKNSHESCVAVADVCAWGGTAKPGFKSLDHINQIGQHAEVVNGDFENVVFDVKDETTNKQTYPVGWEYTDCDINKCQVTKRYESTNPSAERNPEVWRGKYSFLISGQTGKVTSVEQIIENVIPDSIYVVSGWLKVADGQGEEYSGIEIDQLNANGDDDLENNCGYFDMRNPGNPHCLISSGTKKNGWEYFVKKITTQPETRQLRVRLANTGNSTALFDDIQIRAHIEAEPGEYIAPACRLYPGENSLNCDALDNNNNLIRGWRGYCVEPDPRWNSSNPRWTNQCVQWWPIDVISGETNVLGTIEETGYLNAPTPLHYCLETMDKPPGMPLPRLICVAKNDISGLGGEAYKYEACKIVALASDPKPKFYGLDQGDWRLGVDANSFGEKNKVRMVLGGGGGGNESDQKGGEHESFYASGLCVLTSGNYFVGDNNPPSCVQGCFLNEDLAGWGNSDKNRGIPTFRKSPNSNNKTYGCSWSNKQGSNWEECAQDLEQYYHKIAYFVFAQLNGNIDLDSGTAGCWEDGNGDRIYALRGSYASDTPKSKSAYPEKYIYPEVSEAKEITGDNPDGPNDPQIKDKYWYYQSGRVRPEPVVDEGQLKELADILTNDDKLKDLNDPYYIYDNFESVTRGRLNSMTWMERDGTDDGRFSEFSEIVPRVGRPEQCKIMAQTIDVSGHNKAWFNKVQTGVPLDPPLDYDRTSYMCIPFGSAPYIRTPSDIMIEPYDKETFQKMSPVQAPLELYHPENPENNDKSLMCSASQAGQNYKGEGFYSCGGLCNVCAGGDRDGSFCMSDEDCKGEKDKKAGVCYPRNLKGVCAVNADYDHKWYTDTTPITCQTDDDCPSDPCCIVGDGKEGCGMSCAFPQPPCIQCAPYSCRNQDDLNTHFDLMKGQSFKQSEPGISSKPQSGLRRLQNIFAKIYKVWEWIKVEDESLKKKAGIDTGYYREMPDEDLDSILGSGGAWSKERDIANLAVSCIDAFNQGVISPTQFDPSFCKEFPGCRWSYLDQQKGSCVPNGVPFYETGGDPNHYRDYDYCVKINTKSDCDKEEACKWEEIIVQTVCIGGVDCNGKADQSTCEEILGCKWEPAIVSQPWKMCIPYQNQYPDITNIYIDGKPDQVILREDDRNVNLEFKITANQDQKPIVMVLIDWDDNTKTALSGIAWDDKETKSFTHTYAYYPEGASGAPLGCKDYDPDPIAVKYECRFRPRIKVVDNWGWCNGQKITYKDKPIAQKGWEEPSGKFNPIILSDSDLEIEQGEGLSWGYYGADCFIQEYMGRCGTGPYIGNKCIDDSNCGGYTASCVYSGTADSRYGMQSWDYFGGYVQAEPPSEEDRGEDDQAPTVKVSFYDVMVPKLPPYVIGEMFTVQVDCKDDNIVNKCWIEEFSQSGGMPGLEDPKLDCLPALNQILSTFCNGDGSSCYAVEDCHFTGSYDGSKHWKYKATAQDDNLQTGTDFNYDIDDPDDGDDGFAVEGLGSLGIAPTITLTVGIPPDDTPLDYDVETKLPPDGLKTNTLYNFDLTCNSGGADSLYYCIISQSGGSYAMLLDCVDRAAPDKSIDISNGGAQIEVADCNSLTCLGRMQCKFSNAANWVFTLKTADTEGNQVSRPANAEVQAGM